MVPGPGKYRFVDFIKTEFPPAFPIYGVAILPAPRIRPLGL
jgi:hypothetical protein